MTFENILEIFYEHLKNDQNIEVIKTKRGYLRLQWDIVNKDYNVNLITAPDELFNALLDDVANYYEFESDFSFSSDEERKNYINRLQQEYCNKYENLKNSKSIKGSNTMETILYDKIIAKAKELCDDYHELSTEYYRATSALKTNKNMDKISKLENLLKEKSLIECSYAIYKGFILERNDLCISNLNNYNELFEKGVDETIGTKELFDSEEYYNLDNKITNAMNEITTLFKKNSDIIDKLFDTYGNYNYELIRAAYTLGCEYKQYGKVIMNIHI